MKSIIRLLLPYIMTALLTALATVAGMQVNEIKAIVCGSDYQEAVK